MVTATRRYLKQYYKVLYINLLTSGMNTHLAEIDRQVEEMFFRLVKQMAEHEDVNGQPAVKKGARD